MVRTSLLLCCISSELLAQGSRNPVNLSRGGFVTTLGTDTMQVESFTRSARQIDGVVVTRTPATRVLRYQMTLGIDGRAQRIEIRLTDGDGKDVANSVTQARFEYANDSVVRIATRNSVADTTRIAGHPYISPTLPYLGQSYLNYEFAINEVRRAAPGSREGTIQLITIHPSLKQLLRSRVWFPAPDSAELDYFGVARSGYHFDANGQLDRADWTGTTYRYRVARVANIDVEAIARQWAAADARGAAVGALSPRDTSRASVGSATVLIDYSRPSRRGRDLWGDVVKWGSVWRLGADFATHIVLSDTMRVGDAVVPAGTYTLWMLPIQDGTSQLIINKQIRIFGTGYNPANDLVRVPLRRTEHAQSVEKLTLSADDGAIRIRWGTTEWSVPIVRTSQDGSN